MKLAIKERKDGLTWISVQNKDSEHIGWIGLLDFLKGKGETSNLEANQRRLDVAEHIVKLFNESQSHLHVDFQYCNSGNYQPEKKVME